MNIIDKKLDELLKGREKAKIVTEKVAEKPKKKAVVSTENKLLEKINEILLRKDILDVDNDRVDTLRLLTYLIENNGKVSNFVKFLKEK